MGVEIHVRQTHPQDERGHFAKIQSETRNLMRKQALAYQDQVSQEIRHSVGTLSGRWMAERKAQSNNRLSNITNMAGNRETTPLTWNVGRHSFLDGSQAKYWRTFEHGSIAAGWSFRGKYVRFNPGNFPPNSRGKITPFRSFPKGATNFPRGVMVTHEIEGHHVYRHVWTEQNWERRIKTEFAEVLKKNL